MRTIIIMVGLLLACIGGYAQNVNDSIKTKFAYCEIVGTNAGFSSKVKIDVDFGQEVSFWSQDRRLKDETGKSKKFNSIVDALNFMGSWGWELVQTYIVTNTSGLSGVQNIQHWVMKRRIEK